MEKKIFKINKDEQPKPANQGFNKAVVTNAGPSHGLPSPTPASKDFESLAACVQSSLPKSPITTGKANASTQPGGDIQFLSKKQKKTAAVDISQLQETVATNGHPNVAPRQPAIPPTQVPHRQQAATNEAEQLPLTIQDLPAPEASLPTQSTMKLPTALQTPGNLPTMYTNTPGELSQGATTSPALQATMQMNQQEYLGNTQPLPASPAQQPSAAATYQDMGTLRDEMPSSMGKTMPPPVPAASSKQKDPFQLLGTLLVGKYEIVKFLGQGGMGAVYMARHKVLGKERAIKFLPQSTDLNPTSVRRFINEAKAAARVEHANVVQVYDIEETPQFYFIVMELVKGEGLDKYLTRKGALSTREAIQILCPVARGLHVIHQAGMVHRDIKPANIMIAQTGEVKITDFGIVKNLSNTTAGLTGAESILGTPQFMSPEQVRAAQIDCRSDIYSLGATFYYMLTNQQCFQGTAMQMMYQILHVPPIPPHEVNKTIDSKLSAIVLKMMAKDPAQRYQDMSKVIEALENYAKN